MTSGTPTSSLAQLASELTDDELWEAHREYRGLETTGFPYPKKNPYVYIKFGSIHTKTAEARNQEFAFHGLKGRFQELGVYIPEVFRVVEGGNVALIVMEYVAGVTLHDLLTKNPDVVPEAAETAARGVKAMLDLEVPANAVPGPCGGGYLGHMLFKDWESPVQYASIGELEEHINTAANLLYKLKTKSDQNVVTAKLEPTLLFCFTDLWPKNFIYTQSKTICIIDFEAAGFMPLSLFALSATQGRSYPVGAALEKACSLPRDNFPAFDRAAYLFFMSLPWVGLPPKLHQDYEQALNASRRRRGLDPIDLKAGPRKRRADVMAKGIFKG